MSQAESNYLLWRFIAKHTPFGIAIRLDTNSLFEHCELGDLADPTDWNTVRGWIGAHASGGVKDRPVDYCSPFRDYRYATPVTPSQYAKAMTFAHAKIGTKYDLADIAGLAFRVRAWHLKHLEICSKFMFQVAEAAGIQTLNISLPYAYLVTPDMFHLEPFLCGHRVLAKGEPK